MARAPIHSSVFDFWAPPNSLVEFDHLTSTRRDSSLGAMIFLCPKETVFGLVLVEYIF